MKIFLLFIFFTFIQLSASSSGLPVNDAFDLPQYPAATLVTSQPVYFTQIPGPGILNISADSSVIVCFSPGVAILSNLMSQCNNRYIFTFNEDSTPVYQSQLISLLQDVPYYISVGNEQKVSGSSNQVYFSFEALYPECPTGTAANRFYIPNQHPKCTTLDAQLVASNSSASDLSVSSSNNSYFSFENTLFLADADLHIHVYNSTESYQLTLYIAYGYLPNLNDYDFSHTIVPENNAISNEFDSDSYKLDINNPFEGTYYVMITSNLTQPLSFDVEYNASSCSSSSCGDHTITFIPQTQENVISIDLSYGTVQYLGIMGYNATLGFQLTSGNDTTALVQVGLNALPSGNLNYSEFQYFPSSSQASLLSYVGYTQLTYVFAFTLAEESSSSVSLMYWTDSTCPLQCSNHGTCDTETYQCTCNSDFEGSYCQTQSSSKKGLSKLDIVLIIIGAAVIVALLIGIPVACYLRNRKKTEYLSL